MNSFDRIQKNILTYITTIQKHCRTLRKKENVVAVHRLRTSARRLRNIIKVLSGQGFFSVRKIEVWNRKLKILMQATSFARDLDVSILYLKELRRERKYASVRPALNGLIKVIQAKRTKLQPSISKAAARFLKDNILAQMKAELKKHRKKERDILSQKLPGFAAKKINKRLRKFLAYKKYVRRPSCVEELHQMRIAAKGLRYTMETLKPVYGKSMEPFQEAILSIHRTLGDLHDYDVRVVQFPELINEMEESSESKKFKRIIKQHQTALRRKAYQAFVSAWNKCQKKLVWENLEIYVVTFKNAQKNFPV